MRGEGLTVAEAAEILGTTPQTVRTLLRTGELSGHKRLQGTKRYVWEVTPDGIDEFLSHYGRLDGHRRSRAAREQAPAESPVPPEAPAPPPEPLSHPDSPAFAAPEPVDRRPFVLRPRGRATVVVLVLGVPLLVLHAAARIAPDALWFHELGQTDVFTRVLVTKL